MTAATGLPLAQNTLLDEGDTSTFPSIAMYPSGMIDIPDEYDDGMPIRRNFRNIPPDLSPSGAAIHRTSSTYARVCFWMATM